ncbi:sugar transferase [Leptothoe spongobia]|uniref:Sugar transferase n=1 Tax=Leptothoe spongobia TAU-MAC 1115 TaxID=1967444 RepID=A0A947GHS8_9CYAN|nr:sugar transferase [Leptothoe spongobia]MBT9315655.1 sugar transferase [Leptothoe spongobia TAU-MAC 1115]
MISTRKALCYFVKQLVDRTIAAISIVILSPVFIVISILVYFSMGSPVIFTQDRPGQNNRIFKFYKYRTMTNERDARGILLPDSRRLTGIGQFLRKTSLDELPQLFNVVKGDMSFIGPRPLLVEYLPLYSQEQARRHDVPPGISGWVQVNGRNSLDWEEKFKLDIWYVDNWNLWLDIKILILTFVKVLKRDGISHKGHATMDRFKGSTS